MSDIRVDFSHCAAQSSAFRALKPRCTVTNAWGRGVGKSWFDRVVMYITIANWEGKSRATLEEPLRGVRIVFLMPTLRQFRKVHEAALESELKTDGKWGWLGAHIDHTTWRITFPCGSWIQVVSAQNIDDNRGIRCDMLVVDECDDIDIADYESVCGPWFSEPWSLDIRLLSGTPRRGRYGLLWRGYSVWPRGDAEHVALPNHYGYHATYLDAPAIVSRENVERERARTSPDRFAREWGCNFDSGEGLVYPFFDISFHVRGVRGMYLFREYIVGFDYGFVDPAVFLVIGIAGHGRDTILHVLQEVYVTGKSDTELALIAKGIELSFPNAKWYSDHHPSTIRAFKDDACVNVVEADKAIKVEDGVAFVADALFIREDEEGHRWAQFYVDPSCKHTIEEFGLYRRKRDPRNPDRVLDEIDSTQNDHCMDAIRYPLVTHFAGPDRRLVLG